MKTTPDTPLLHFFDLLGLILPCADTHFRWAESDISVTPVNYGHGAFGSKPTWKSAVCDCETEAQVIAKMQEQAAPLDTLHGKHLLILMSELPCDPDEKSAEFRLKLHTVKGQLDKHVATILEVPGVQEAIALDPNLVNLRQHGGRYGIQNTLNSIYKPSEEQLAKLLPVIPVRIDQPK